LTVGSGLTYTDVVDPTNASQKIVTFTAGTGTISWQWGYFP
jgi:hypothetical protein